MTKRTILAVAAAMGLAFGVAQTASAQAPTVHCTVAAGSGLAVSDGLATIEPGTIDMDLDNTEKGKFVFKGKNMNCTGPAGTPLKQTICSLGDFAAGGNCVGNSHSGRYIVCEGADSCTITGLGTATGSVACNTGAPLLTGTPAKSTFKGMCQLANCTGSQNAASDKPLAYNLNFDNATDVAALTKCPNPANPPPNCGPSNTGVLPGGCSLTEASFGGTIDYTP